MPKEVVFTEDFLKKLKSFQTKSVLTNVGYIASLGDGVVEINGLSEAGYNEILEFTHDVFGVVFNLGEDRVGSIILGDFEKLQEGDEVKTTGRILEIPVSEHLIGRVVDPLARPLDGKGEILAKKAYPLEKIAPGVIQRQSVNTPLQTGIKAIDSMIPIGRGQRELIIGDRGTGKTALVIDTIMNQKDQGVSCIYVSIGQKTARLRQIIDRLEKYKAFDYTIVVAANASDPTSLQYIAPYAGVAIGEYFMDQGRDVLIVYDDLTKHAWAYRQISLLMRRPSGREAYPGDVFYLHSRLLERACKLSKECGGGSITALPIIETQAGDVSAYIPTNVISITDGQIFLESDLFYAGQRPAVNPGISVSRVGGAAQIKAMKKVAGKIRLDLAQYRELAAFAQFSTDLDPATKAQIDRGAHVTEILKQDQYKPMPVEEEVAILWVATNGYLDDLPLRLVRQFEESLLAELKKPKQKLLSEIKEKKEITAAIEEDLRDKVLGFKEDFKKMFAAETESH